MKKKILMISILIPMVVMMFFNYSVKATSSGKDLPDGRTTPYDEWRDKPEGGRATQDIDFDSIIKSADDFLADGDETKISTENMQTISNMVYNVLLTIGVIAAFIVGAILGIKFITSGLEGRADVKQMLVPYIIGLVVLFGAFTIWKVVLTVLQSNI